MIRFYKTPWFVRLWYSKLSFNVPSENGIFLTFDDGPNPKVTPWVLNELDKFNAKASFFCLGKNAEQNPELITKIVSDGHTIGNHTYSHLKGWDVSDSLYCQDIALCDEVLSEQKVITKFFRPPYGRIKKSQLIKLDDKKVIMWSHLSWDFDLQLNVSKSIQKLKKAKSGGILVFHESEQSFENLKIILPEILSHFQSKGFKFEAL